MCWSIGPIPFLDLVGPYIGNTTVLKGDNCIKKRRFMHNLPFIHYYIINIIPNFTFSDIRLTKPVLSTGDVLCLA